MANADDSDQGGRFDIDFPDQPFRMEGSKGRFYGVNAAGALLGGGLLYLILRGREDFSSGAFLVLWILLVAYMAADALVWRSRGVREVEVGPKAFRVRRGTARGWHEYGFAQVSDFHVHSRGARKSVQILLGEKVVKVPGIITLYPGPKIWITSDAFDDGEFEEFIQRMRRGLAGVLPGPEALPPRE
ncbi:MAG: hypothetical protein AB1407_02380 [Spirochaetota bacterium]